MAIQVGPWQLDVVSGGNFRTDGGVLFGMVPKTVWQSISTPDPLNRCLVATNCLLARNGQHVVLIDTGYGGKNSPLDRKVNGLEPGEPLLESLARHGVTPHDVTHVVFSHLHFDHAGGATQLDERRRLRPTFPQARHWVHRWEWEDATSNAPELRAGYPSQNFLPLAEAGLVDVYDADGEILPGLHARLTGGHTRGHQALLFAGDDAALLFIGDICPTAAHIRPQWHTAYDQFPLQTRVVKPALLGEAADRKWLIVWNHDPLVPVSRVARHRTQEFIVADAWDGSCPQPAQCTVQQHH